MKKIERKMLAADAVEFKFDGETGIIEGYASVFDGVDSYGDTVIKGAFRETLKDRERSVKMRWNHFGPVIGKWLDIHETDKGLKVKGQLTPGHSVAADVLASLKHGAIDGLSIGYFVTDSDQKKEGGRLLKGIELVEISVVEEQADLAAKVTQVKAVEECGTLSECERFLRENTELSDKCVKTLVSRIKSIACRDGEQEAKAAAMVALIQRLNIPK